MNIATQYRRETDPVEELLNEFISDSVNQNDDGNQNLYVVKVLDMNYIIQGSSDCDCSKGQEQHDQDKDIEAGIIDSVVSPNSGELKKNDVDSIKEEYQNADSRQPVQTILSQYKNDVGETSFSAMASLTNPSGSFPFLRNDSTRSDASTISTQSLAFPILNSEWNMSPVKLNKNDQRHAMIKKHRSRWRSLFCCSF